MFKQSGIRRAYVRDSEVDKAGNVMSKTLDPRPVRFAGDSGNYPCYDSVLISLIMIISKSRVRTTAEWNGVFNWNAN